MKDILIIMIIACIIGSIVLYLYKAKKRGDACIGCPHAKQCGGQCGNSSPTSLKEDE